MQSKQKKHKETYILTLLVLLVFIVSMQLLGYCFTSSSFDLASWLFPAMLIPVAGIMFRFNDWLIPNHMIKYILISELFALSLNCLMQFVILP